MSKQVINLNYPADLINIGATANDRNGDPLRTAFTKINDAIDRIDSNFSELYNAATLVVSSTAPDTPIVGSLWYDTISGTLYIYYDSNWVDSNPPPAVPTDISDLTDTTNLLGSGGGISITDFGEGFSLTSANKIVTNKLYSTNLTQSTQHYRLELDTNGVVHLPDQSIINGATLKSVAGNYAGITAGPVGKDEDSWMWVDNNGAWVGTDYSTNGYTWQFQNDGNLKLPLGGDIVDSNGDSVLGTGGSSDRLTNGIHELVLNVGGAGPYITFPADDGASISIQGCDITGAGFEVNLLSAEDGVRLSANATSDRKDWLFGADGNLTLPGTGTINNPAGGTIGSIYTFNTDYMGASSANDAGAYLADTVNSQNIAIGWVVTFSDNSTKTVTAVTRVPSTYVHIEWSGSIAYTYPFTVQSADYAVTVNALELTPDGTTTWTFGTDGGLTFPDTTVQATAYTGTAATATSASTAASVGYIGMPQNSKSANYELVIGDMGKHVYVTATSTVTIPAYTSVDFPIGTTIAVVAGTGATVSIAITTDTMNLAGPGTTGTRTLAPFGMATLVKVAQSTWFISGVGLT